MSPLSRLARLLALAGLGAMLTACPGGSPDAPPVQRAAGSSPTADEDFACEPVDVPAGDFELLGDPRACKGGRIVMESNSYPTHLSFYGPERSASHRNRYSKLTHNTLVSVHPSTLAYVPDLASSWEENDGGRELIFHLDPDARWSDGVPVTAADVVFTYDLMHHPRVVEVLLTEELAALGMQRPEALDTHTVRIRCAKPSWRNLLQATELYIMPAHAIDPETYRDEWRFDPPVVSGQYDLGPYEDGKFISFERRKDFWGEGKRQYVGVGNFDTIYWRSVSNSDLAFEAVKKGDIDIYLVGKAQRWAEECDFERAQKGWVQKMKMYHQQPEVPSQMAMNVTSPLFEDTRVRQAMAYLYNREYLLEELFYDQYEAKHSYYANSIYENPDNPRYDFDPRKALGLLQAAGWSEKDAEGVLVKDGRRFEFDFIYIHPASDRVYTPIQETYRKYGIKMNLKLIAPSAWIKVMESKDFVMTYINWGSTPFPTPRALWDSRLADKPLTDNITHFKNAEVDALLDQYDLEADVTKRAGITRQIDAILMREMPYLLDWYASFFRLLWWDKFGMPEWCAYSTMDIRDTWFRVWWYEPGRAERLEAARLKDEAVPLASAENTHWLAN
jgi:microcin C transport system substrate-binding protein